jgi:hypothetical protein
MTVMLITDTISIIARGCVCVPVFFWWLQEALKLTTVSG